jgi:hypothetical protein
VRVTEGSTPPRPSPACENNGTYTINASDSGPRWSAICVKMGVVLWFENHGPDGFVVAPSDAVNCQYEAGVRECRFVRAGTVMFTVTNPNEARPINVVVIR